MIKRPSQTYGASMHFSSCNSRWNISSDSVLLSLDSSYLPICMRKWDECNYVLRYVCMYVSVCMCVVCIWVCHPTDKTVHVAIVVCWIAGECSTVCTQTQTAGSFTVGIFVVGFRPLLLSPISLVRGPCHPVRPYLPFFVVPRW